MECGWDGSVSFGRYLHGTRETRLGKKSKADRETDRAIPNACAVLMTVLEGGAVAIQSQKQSQSQEQVT